MIPEAFVAAAALTAFCGAIYCLPVLPIVRAILDAAASGIGTMMDAQVDDDASEIAVRQAGFRILSGLIKLIGCVALAVFAAAVPMGSAHVLFSIPPGNVIEFMLRLDVLVATTLAAVGIVALARTINRRKEVPEASPTGAYTASERIVHALAFSGPGTLSSLSWLEDRILTSPQDTDPSPIFLTSLARAGTTAVLNALAGIDGIATHTYRDMPFITAPLLWDRIAGGRSRSVALRSRVHNDGHFVGLDSPEAFEEVLWRASWPGKYMDHGISPWHEEDRKPASEAFMLRHMGKIIAARRRDSGAQWRGAWRYASKNNANIARIPFLLRAFKTCRIVVIVRRPDCHAASMLRQHQNFSRLQRNDAFARRYMRDLGHFEFGLDHKPLLFDGLNTGDLGPAMPDYWLSYWIAAFEAVLPLTDCYLIVSQDELRTEPQETMTGLCDALSLSRSSKDFRRFFHTAPDAIPEMSFSPKLLSRANELYSALTNDRMAIRV